MENKEIIQLLRLQKSLVYFTTALKSNEIMIDKLQKDKFSNLKPANQDLLEDLLIENKQTMEMAVIYSEILTGLMDAFASIISNNLNVVMKFLTSLTILLTIPMLIVSVFGMNIPLPLTTSKYALGIIGLIALLSMGVGIYYFRKQKYL